MMEDRVFGDSGSRVVIEEFLRGPEVSVLAFTDGDAMVPMVSSMDHKRALDGDNGPNTGGMGTVAPNPYYTPQLAARAMEEIYIPTMEALNAEDRTFKGCLYFGLILTEDGPKVIEYNCRFGDPEAQVVLPLLSSDLLNVMEATVRGDLANTEVEFRDGAACCVVMASAGYPGAYESGFPIAIPEDLEAEVYVAGAKLVDGELTTGGGRVLGVTATGATLTEAVAKAYEQTARVTFDNAYFRRDIGAKALSAEGRS